MYKKNLVLTLTCIMLLAACSQQPSGSQYSQSIASLSSTNQSSSSQSSQSSSTSLVSTAQTSVPVEEGVPNFNPTGFPIVNEPITLELFVMKLPIHGPFEDMEFWRYMTDLTKVSYTFITAPQDSYTEKKNLLFASNDLPDAFMGGDMTAVEQAKYGAEGLLIPLEDIIDAYGHNLLASFDEYPELRRNITLNDGHIYALPMFNTAPRAVQDAHVYVNYHWLDALGISKEDLPSVIEDFHDLLVRFRDEDPNQNGQADEIPMTFVANATNNAQMRWFFMTAYGVLHDDNGFYAQPDGKVVFQFNSDMFRTYLETARLWYAEKLIDQDVFTQTPQQRIANSKDNLVGVCIDVLSGLSFDTTGEDSTNYPVLPTLTSKYNNIPIRRLKNTVQLGKFEITDRNQYPEATLRYADYFFCKEGFMIQFQGVPNENWEYIDAEQIKWRSLVPEGENMEEYRFKHTPNLGPGMQFPEIIRGKTNIEEVYADNNGFDTLNQLQFVFPIVYFTDDEQERVDIIQSDINLYVIENEAKFIAGQMPLNDETWNTYVNMLNTIGIDELLGYYQAAYDRWLSN